MQRPQGTRGATWGCVNGLGTLAGFQLSQRVGVAGADPLSNVVALQPGPEMQLSLQLNVRVAVHALGISVLPEASNKLSQPSGMQQPLLLSPNVLS